MRCRHIRTPLVLATLVFLGLLVLPSSVPAQVKKTTKGDQERVAELEKLVAKLQKEIQALKTDMRIPPPQPGAVREIKIYKLQRADPAKMGPILETILQTPDRTAIRSVPDQRTNSLIVIAPREVQMIVEVILIRLDEP